MPMTEVSNSLVKKKKRSQVSDALIQHKIADPGVIMSYHDVLRVRAVIASVIPPVAPGPPMSIRKTAIHFVTCTLPLTPHAGVNQLL